MNKNFYVIGVIYLYSSLVLADLPSSLINKGQEKTNWCWAANSEMILDWDDSDTSQSDIANFAVSGANIGNYLDANGWGPFRIPGTEVVFFQKGIKQVLEHFGEIKSEKRNAALSEAEAKEFLDNGNPFIVAEYWSTGGGHVMVAKDYASSNFMIEDPWPLDNNPAPGKAGVSASVPYSTLTGATPNYQATVFGSSSTIGNTWGQTLTLGKSLDIVFLIDSTGSMGPYINNVKSQADTLITDLKSKFKDVRIAVVDYRDYPQDPYGDPGDYITQVRSAFTTDLNAARAAITAISVDGGNDIPEALYSAVTLTALGDGIGAWREGNGVSRHIILMGDAEGHSPEPWTGGKSLTNALTALNSPTHPISVQAVHVGNSSSAGADFLALASVNQGQKTSTVSADNVSGIITGFIDDISNGLFPVGQSKNPYPTFSWTNVGGSLASAPNLDTLAIELETFYPGKGWRKYKRYGIKDINKTSLTIDKSLPIGEYRWRKVGGVKASNFSYPDGTVAKTEDLGNFVEEDFTTFSRVSNVPGPITKFTASCTSSPVVLFEEDSNVDVYAIKTVQDGKTKIDQFKASKLTSGEGGVLTANLTKVKSSQPFCWTIQGLNEDRPVVDPAAFN